MHSLFDNRYQSIIGTVRYLVRHKVFLFSAFSTLQENFRFVVGKSSGPAFRGRTERYVFLFQRLVLITKKEEDGYQYKTHLEVN